MKKILVTIEETGEIKITTTGYRGKACQVATADLEKALGVKTKSEPTPDMYLPETQQQRVTQ